MGEQKKLGVGKRWGEEEGGLNKVGKLFQLKLYNLTVGIQTNFAVEWRRGGS